jgi:hypothetical protein
MIEKFTVTGKPPRIQGNTFDIETYNAPRAREFVDWVNDRLTELNLDICALDPKDPLNESYNVALEKAQGGMHDGLPKQMRYHVMQQLAAQAIRQDPWANVVECGCWQGHSTLLLERIVLHHGDHTTRLHVFDSFEGLSEFTSKDESPLLDKRAQRAVREGFRSDYETLYAKTNTDCTVLHKGWIPEVFKEYAGQHISFANIDVDLYEPTRAALAFVYLRMTTGGIIFFDDYGFKIFPGATTAVDEHVALHPWDLFVALPTGGAFLVKP